MQALPGVGAAVISVAIAVAGLAAGEAPEAGQAAVALSPVHARKAVALARLRVAEGVVRTSDVALASCKERRKGAVFQCPVPSPVGSLAQSTGSHVRLHPLGPNPKVPGAHLSHCLPTTLGRHWHCPPLGSHTELSEPWGSHWQARKREALGSSEHCCVGHPMAHPMSTCSPCKPGSLQVWFPLQAGSYVHKAVSCNSAEMLNMMFLQTSVIGVFTTLLLFSKHRYLWKVSQALFVTTSSPEPPTVNMSSDLQYGMRTSYKTILQQPRVTIYK